MCGNVTGSRHCPTNYTCRCVGDNPNHGYTSFDNFLWSMLTTFQLITLDYWENVYNMVSKSIHHPPIDTITDAGSKRMYAIRKSSRNNQITREIHQMHTTSTYILLKLCNVRLLLISFFLKSRYCIFFNKKIAR